ncbi:hypothetical protein ACIXNK_02805 [Bacteroides fragilis]
MWDTERKEMFTSPQSVERGMRNLLGIPGKSGFSSVDVRPQLQKYIPLMCTGMPDKNGVLLWEGDYVEFKFDETMSSMLKEKSFMSRRTLVSRSNLNHLVSLSLCRCSD